MVENTRGVKMPWPSPQDYSEAVQTAQSSFADPELRSGTVETNSLGLPRSMSGNFATVFCFQCNGRKVAVRCFLHNVPDQHSRYSAISKYVLSDDLSCTVPVAYIEQGINIRNQWYPILKMEWVDGVTLNQFVQQHLSNTSLLNMLASYFKEMTSDLRRAGVAHGDLQHDNILISEDELRLVDYDGMYVPALSGWHANEIGHPNYQHPQRSANHFAPHLDNFSAWVIYSSLKILSRDPTLYQTLNGGGDCLLFRKSDFLQPDQSQAFRILNNHSDHHIRDCARALQYLLQIPIDHVPNLEGCKLSVLAKNFHGVGASVQNFPTWLHGNGQELNHVREVTAASDARSAAPETSSGLPAWLMDKGVMANTPPNPTSGISTHVSKTSSIPSQQSQITPAPVIESPPFLWPPAQLSNSQIGLAQVNMLSLAKLQARLCSQQNALLGSANSQTISSNSGTTSGQLASGISVQSAASNNPAMPGQPSTALAPAPLIRQMVAPIGAPDPCYPNFTLIRLSKRTGGRSREKTAANIKVQLMPSESIRWSNESNMARKNKQDQAMAVIGLWCWLAIIPLAILGVSGATHFLLANTLFAILGIALRHERRWIFLCALVFTSMAYIQFAFVGLLSSVVAAYIACTLVGLACRLASTPSDLTVVVTDRRFIIANNYQSVAHSLPLDSIRAVEYEDILNSIRPGCSLRAVNQFRLHHSARSIFSRKKNSLPSSDYFTSSSLKLGLSSVETASLIEMLESMGLVENKAISLQRLRAIMHPPSNTTAVQANVNQAAGAVSGSASSTTSSQPTTLAFGQSSFSGASLQRIKVSGGSALQAGSSLLSVDQAAKLLGARPPTAATTYNTMTGAGLVIQPNNSTTSHTITVSTKHQAAGNQAVATSGAVPASNSPQAPIDLAQSTIKIESNPSSQGAFLSIDQAAHLVGVKAHFTITNRAPGQQESPESAP